MSGSTPELALKTAVDADDTADYLTISLATSLTTLDALFNSATGHTHVGAHQGGPVAPAAGSITSGMIADGTIATADLANAAVTNAKLASDVGRANLLTNGSFDLWARGAGPYTASGAYFADRWTTSIVGSDTLSVSRATGGNVDVGSLASVSCTMTLGTGAGQTGLVQTLKQAEGYQLAGKSVSFSLRVKTTVAAAVRAGVAVDGVYSYSSFHTGDNTWQSLTVPNVTVPAAWTGTLQVFAFFAAAGTHYVDNAVLVAGSQPADYAPLHPADDQGRVLRYYQRFSAPSNQSIGFGQAYSGTNGMIGIPLLAVMPGAPTLTVSAAGDWALTSNAFANNVCTAVAAGAMSPDHVVINASVSGGVAAGNCTALRGNTGTAWLALEYNP